MKKPTEDQIYINDSEMKYLRGNSYVAFLLRQIDQELGRMSCHDVILPHNVNATFDLHDIMWLSIDDNSDFFWFNLPDNRQFAEYVMCIFMGSPDNDSADAIGDPDQSWMLKRIATLKKDFAENIKKISKECGIPYNSVVKMYHLLVYCKAYTEFGDEILNQFPDFPEDFWQIQVPVDLSDVGRENLVIKLWGRIRKLFIECLHVFIFTGALENLYLTGIYQKDGLEITKTRLLSTAVDEEMAHIIRSIHSEIDLQEYFRNNLFCFIDGLINIANSFKTYLDLTAFKKLKRIMKSNEISMRTRELFKYSSLIEFSNRLTKSTGMLQKYVLQGDPHNLVKYTQRTFNNLSRNFIKKHFEEVAKEKFGISKRQLDRYNKNLKKGDYDHLFSDENPKPKSIYDISVNDFKAIREIESRKLKHRKYEHFSQNQLISTLTASNMEDFESREFTQSLSPQQAVEEILKAGYAVPEEFSEYNDDDTAFQTLRPMQLHGAEEFSEYNDDDTSRAVDLLNFILEMPDFVDGVIKVKPDFVFSNDVKNRIIETGSVRKLDFDKIPESKKRSIKTLNRSVLEEVHPDVTPKGIKMNSFSWKYGINFEKISPSTYKNILRKLIADGKIQVEKEGQTNLYPATPEYIANIASQISEHQKYKRNK